MFSAVSAPPSYSYTARKLMLAICLFLKLTGWSEYGVGECSIQQLAEGGDSKVRPLHCSALCQFSEDFHCLCRTTCLPWGSTGHWLQLQNTQTLSFYRCTAFIICSTFFPQEKQRDLLPKECNNPTGVGEEEKISPSVNKRKHKHLVCNIIFFFSPSAEWLLLYEQHPRKGSELHLLITGSSGDAK